MKKIKNLLTIVLLGVFTMALIKCAKEEKIVTSNNEDSKMNLRENGSACNPQDLFSHYVQCTFVKINDTVKFGNNSSSNDNFLFKMCPGVELKVTYYLTTCIDQQGLPVTLISGLTYNMNELFAACHELDLAFRKAYYGGGSFVDLLDKIDDEISQQIEFQMAYEEVSKHKIDCSPAYYSIKYIKNTCYKWDWVSVIGTGDDKVWAKVDCGSSVCCARHNRYCATFYPDGKIKNFIKKYPTEYESFEGQCSVGCSHECRN